MDKPDHELHERLLLAKTNKDELNLLVSQYLPFIKKQAADAPHFGLEPEDMLSIAMLVFTNCVLQFVPERGNFFSFAAACIRNRLIDEGKKLKKQVPGSSLDMRSDAQSAEQAASILCYNKAQEQQRICEEISLFSDELRPYGICFSELPASCPKQNRARALCLNLAQYIVRQETLLRRIKQHHKIPQQELAAQFHISAKTVEKHRKYIVALVILLTKDFPCIRAFLPTGKEGSR